MTTAEITVRNLAFDSTDVLAQSFSFFERIPVDAREFAASLVYRYTGDLDALYAAEVGMEQGYRGDPVDRVCPIGAILISLGRDTNDTFTGQPCNWYARDMLMNYLEGQSFSAAEIGRFMDAWDTGLIPPDTLGRVLLPERTTVANPT
jgi:hypothetical protein